jgi:hypothetical protein
MHARKVNIRRNACGARHLQEGRASSKARIAHLSVATLLGGLEDKDGSTLRAPLLRSGSETEGPEWSEPRLFCSGGDSRPPPKSLKLQESRFHSVPGARILSRPPALLMATVSVAHRAPKKPKYRRLSRKGLRTSTPRQTLDILSRSPTISEAPHFADLVRFALSG